MGWGRYFFLGDLGQQLDLSDQRAEIERLREELRRSHVSSPDATGPMSRLQAENDELRLYLAAIVRLLISKGIVSREEISRVVDIVDAEDGRFKGNIA